MDTDKVQFEMVSLQDVPLEERAISVGEIVDLVWDFIRVNRYFRMNGANL